MAQFGRAPCSGRGGRRFKSCQPDHFLLVAFFEVISMIKFSKWQACGNDFIIIEDGSLNDLKAKASFLCERHFGIGADGILLLTSSDVADVNMVVINADGSIAQMCGNGVRCVGRYIGEKLNRTSISVETGGGIKDITINGETATVDMGNVNIEWTKRISVEGDDLRIWSANVGNPHCVIKMPKVVSDEYLCRVGSKIENMINLFPEKTNVEFVVVESADKIRVRVWERGCGKTMACGTGACASATVMAHQSIVKPEVQVEMDGGTLKIEVGRTIKMSGAAKLVYNGEIN